MGWDWIIGADGVFVGMSGFGASAPYKELYAHFGITAEAVVEGRLPGCEARRRASTDFSGNLRKVWQVC